MIANDVQIICRNCHRILVRTTFLLQNTLDYFDLKITDEFRKLKIKLNKLLKQLFISIALYLYCIYK